MMSLELKSSPFYHETRYGDICARAHEEDSAIARVDLQFLSVTTNSLRSIIKRPIRPPDFSNATGNPQRLGAIK